jgi:ABC-2 type transport system permease protein
LTAGGRPAETAAMVFPTMVKMGIKRLFRYPWGLLMSVVIDPIILVLNIILYHALFAYSGTATIAGYQLEQMIWYFAATSFIWYWTWNFTDRSMGQRVLSGDLTIDLIRPLSVFSLELSRAVSLRVSGVLFEFLPILAIYSIFVPHPFMTWVTLLQFVLSAALAFLLFFTINFLIGMSATVLQNNTSAAAIKFILVAGLGGSFVPLEFFPPQMTEVLKVLPFSSLFYWPIQFFLGKGGDWASFGLHSMVAAGWIACFWVLDALLWRASIRRYAGAGG